MSNDTSRSFMGFETFWNNLRMAAKMERYILILCTLAAFSVCVVIYFSYLNKTERSILQSYHLAKFRDEKSVTQLHINGKEYNASFRYVVSNYKPYAEMYQKKYLKKAKTALWAYLLFIPFNLLFYFRAKRQSEENTSEERRL